MGRRSFKTTFNNDVRFKGDSIEFKSIPEGTGDFTLGLDENENLVKFEASAGDSLTPVAAPANSAAVQSASYVQADAQSVLTELRALKTALVNSGILT